MPQAEITNAPVSKEDAVYSTLDVLILLARRKRFIGITAFAAGALGLIVSLLLPNQYTAETVVLTPTQNSSMSSMLMSQLGGGALASLAGANLGIKNPGDLYVSLFRSRTVEDAVIERFGLRARYGKKRLVDTRKKFESRASVLLGAKDGLIRISVRDKDPKVAAEIANGYVEEFRKASALMAITEASQRRLFFQKQLEEAKDNLATAEIAMKNTEQATGVLQIDAQAKALIESAASLRAQMVAKQVQIQGMRTFATEDNPDLVTAKQQLAVLQGQLSKLGGSEQDGTSDLIVPKGKIPEAGMQYIRKYRDVKYYETIYELIAKQFEVAKIDEARQGSMIQVADVAVPPDKKSSPNTLLITILAVILGTTVAVLWTIFAESLLEMRRSPEAYSKLEILRTEMAK